MKNWSEKLLTGSVQQNKNRAHRYAAIASLETLSCAATSIALEFASKFFAKRGVTVRDPDLHNALVDETNAPVSGSHKSEGTAGASGTKNENEVKQPAVIVPQEADKFAHLKKKPFSKGQTHVDAAKASETSFSLAT